MQRGTRRARSRHGARTAVRRDGERPPYAPRGFAVRAETTRPPDLFAGYLALRSRLHSARVAQRRKTGQRGPVPNTIDQQASFRTPDFTTNHAFNAIDRNLARQVFNNRNVLMSTIVQMTDNQAKSEVKHGFSNRGKAGAQPVPGGGGGLVTGGPFATEVKYPYIFIDVNHNFVQRGDGIIKVATHHEAGHGYRLGHVHGIGARSGTQTGTLTWNPNNPNQLSDVTFP